MIASLRRWLAARADAYVVLLTALGFNLLPAALALSRHLEGVPLRSAAGVYAGLVFIGYYGLVMLVLLTALFIVTWFSRRLTLLLGGTVLFAILAYLVINSFVYRTYGFHVDAFWIHFFFTSYSGIGVSPANAAAIGIVLLASIAFQVWVVRLSARLAFRKRIALITTVAVIGSFLIGQVIHIVAYYRSDTRITGITPQLPFYSPVVSQKNAARYGDLVNLGLGPDQGEPSAATSLHYPLHEVTGRPPRRPPNIVLLLLESWRYDMMDSLTSPNTFALSRRSSTFLHHLSSGNSTPAGVFGLFYAIHPTYWAAVKANNAAIHNPVLIDQMEQNHYSFGIFADSQFGRHKIKDAMFRDITVHEQFAGEGPDGKDADCTNQLIAFMDHEHQQGHPFFGFVFYKSTHYSYRYPASCARFQPAKDLNIAVDGQASDATPFLNDCRNSVYYTDSLVGRVIRHLEQAGLMNETIVIVTSDHGEEFNDNHVGSWGHCGNFTRWQVQVPLVFYVPGRAPRQVTETTTHIDVPTTLLKEVFGCDDIRDYSNGVDLFDPWRTRGRWWSAATSTTRS
jgi:membrane-anchored protein YejM (alkaline phosphatase superfamily)